MSPRQEKLLAELNPLAREHTHFTHFFPTFFPLSLPKHFTAKESHLPTSHLLRSWLFRTVKRGSYSRALPSLVTAVITFHFHPPMESWSSLWSRYIFKGLSYTHIYVTNTSPFTILEMSWLQHVRSKIDLGRLVNVCTASGTSYHQFPIPWYYKHVDSLIATGSDSEACILSYISSKITSFFFFFCTNFQGGQWLVIKHQCHK